MRNAVFSAQRVFAFLFFLALVPVAVTGVSVAGASVAQAQTIRSISVEGNQRIDAETVRSYLSLKAGGAYTASGADESLKTLFSTGLFSDVQLNMRGSVLVVSVVENPLINKVSFEGNRKLKDELLASEVESKPRSMLTRSKIQSDTQRILQLYRRSGRFSARVEPKIIDLDQNRVNLVFEIDEGDKTSVSRINFVGNVAYTDSALRDVLITSEKNWLSWLKKSDVYDPDRLEADKEMLRRYYLKSGYADFRVVSAIADYDRERNAFYITFTVDEGQRYRFGNVDIISNVPDVDPAALYSLVQTDTGSVYNNTLVDKTLEDMTIELSRAGYAFAQVRPRGNRNYEDQTIDMTYVVDEGPRAYIERIEIRGNTRTLDNVIRRELDFAEGDAYNRVLVDRGLRRLQALNFFEKVAINRERGSSPDRVILYVDVQEKLTGEISAGAGYSSSEGFIADVSISERNFLGRGQYVKIGGSFGSRKENYEFSFTEPYFMDRRLAVGFDVFSRYSDLTNVSSYESQTTGGGLRAGFELNEQLSVLFQYQYYRSEITIPAALNDNCITVALTPIPCGAGGIPGEASPVVKSGAGQADYSVLGYHLTYSTLDNPRRPRNGILARFSQEVAGLGGDVNFLRTTGEFTARREILPDIVLMGRVQGGHIAGFGGQGVRMFDSFFKGGETIRGFDSAGYGPRDLLSHDALGGTLYFNGTIEIQFPIPVIPSELGFRGAIFADAGTLYDIGTLPAGYAACGAVITGPCYVDSSKIRSSVGVSILWDSPFGPVRGDLGYALTKEPYDETQTFRFGGGAKF
ncbi:MAG: outer membrane protein assembly factor BamA [Flavobacteriaceae bacterium]